MNWFISELLTHMIIKEISSDIENKNYVTANHRNIAFIGVYVIKVHPIFLSYS